MSCHFGILIDTESEHLYVGIIRNANVAGFQGGKWIKAVIWGRREVGSSGFLSSFETRKMA